MRYFPALLRHISGPSLLEMWPDAQNVLDVTVTNPLVAVLLCLKGCHCDVPIRYLGRIQDLLRWAGGWGQDSKMSK